MTRYAIALGVVLALLAGVWLHGDRYGRTVTDAAWEKKSKAAVETAIALERKQQEGVNDALYIQAGNLAAINDALIADLDRLRKRPSRVSASIYPSATCAGGSGATLSREDAEFLSGETARCDSIRVGLIGCYSAYDALSR